jgi:phosphoenolpyruvate---glycerone phosphotransferase subunit DhaM
MIGIVAVSHSPALAAAAVDLAMQMAGDAPPKVRVAAGASDGSTGTDATAIAAAIDEVAGDDGALVLMDLGSAILSTQLALEFISTGAPVRLSAAPFVEGLVSAVVVASTGAPLDDVHRETLGAMDAKRAQLADDETAEADAAEAAGAGAAAPGGGSAAPADAPPADAESFEAVITNTSGLHARPAASFVKAVGRHDAKVEVADLDSGAGPVSGASLISLMSLGVTKGTRVRVSASGPQAGEALAELRSMIADGFGED